MKKLFILSAFLLSFAIFIPKTLAFEVRVGDSIKLSAEEVAEGNVYASCSQMDIEGTVIGDVIALCKKINISGKINGDLIAFGEEVNISGEITGSVRTAGTSLKIAGHVGRNISAFASEFLLEKNSLVGIDVLLATVNTTVDGSISGNLHGVVSSVKINGKIGKNVDLKIDDSLDGGVLLEKEAVINGDLNYSSAKEILIESPSSVLGKINYKKIESHKTSAIDITSKIIYRVFSLLLIGLIIFSLRKNIFTTISKDMEKNLGKNVLFGLGFFFLTPLITFLFAITLIGLPLAIILLMIYLIISVLAIIFISFVGGDLLLKKIIKKPFNSFLSLTLGLTIFSVLSIIPLFSFLLICLVIIIGSGAIILKIKKSIYV